ncbi:MAG: hypothetical protein QXF35_00740 [Candidatus Bilamarchaeaceae archaeon]
MDSKFLILLVLFLIVGASIINWGTYAGIILIFAIIVFGGLSLFWKEKNIKIAGLVFILLLSLVNIGVNGLKFGIDFKGGTRIPVILERSVDDQTMTKMVSIIKERAGAFGLSEVKVRAVGNNQIDVEIPSSDEQRIKTIEDVLSHKGVYWGVIDGRIAISGDHIFSKSIGAMDQQSLLRSGADWGISFMVDREGAEMFARAAKGKGDYPVYMFLDRPNDADIFYTRAEIRAVMLGDSGEKETITSLKNALKLNDGSTIGVYILDDVLNSTNITIGPRTNNTIAIVSKNASVEYKQKLEELGYKVKETEWETMKPDFIRTTTGVLVVEKLEAVGLLSAPILNPDLGAGTPAYNFAITGSLGNVTGAQKALLAREKMQYMESILKGGSLPVGISLGSRTTVPPTLGEQFLNLSMISIAISLIVISLLIGLRYRNIKATLPIVAISLTEFAILISVLGSFTIDLAAIAGILAAIGVGVDAQIVITDELLKKDKRETEEKIGYAFEIIKTNVIVASLSMLPLLFSKIISGVIVVEIIGFAISTILGALLGYLLSRPAYAVIVEYIIERNEKEENKSSAK